MSLDELADAWWRYQLTGDSTDHPDWWAVEAWMEAEQLPEQTRRLGILRVIERAPDGADLGYVGAMQLEEFVADDESRLAWIEEEAARSERFRLALRNVWCHRDVSPESFERLERAAGAPLRRSGAPTDAQIEFVADLVLAEEPQVDPVRRESLIEWLTRTLRRAPS